MTLRTGVVVVLTIALLATMSFGAVSLASGASAGTDCQAIKDGQVCIQDFSTPDTLLIGGKNGTISVTVENVGSTETEVLVVLNTLNPNNETSSFPLAQPTLASGESKTVTQQLNATTPGTHGLRMILVDPSTGQQYDTSESMTLEIRTEPAPGLGGPIDRTEIALAALLAAIVGIVGFGLYIRD